MQKCGPWPKAMWGLGERSTRNVPASAKTDSSRLAEPKKSASASPARICWPPTSVSCRAVRMKWRSGVVQRNIGADKSVHEAYKLRIIRFGKTKHVRDRAHRVRHCHVSGKIAGARVIGYRVHGRLRPVT